MSKGSGREMSAWRLVKAPHASAAFEGEGAFRFGGRWNSRGTRVVYASSSLALAALEFLVHLDPAAPVPELTALRIRIPTAVVAAEESADGGTRLPLAVSRARGDRWAREGKSAVLRVPSVIVPVEDNFLVNPAHPDFTSLRIDLPLPLSL